MRCLKMAGTTLLGLAAATAFGTAALAAPTPPPTTAADHGQLAVVDHGFERPGPLGYAAGGLILVVGAASMITIAHLRRTAHVATHASR